MLLVFTEVPVELLLLLNTLLDEHCCCCICSEGDGEFDTVRTGGRGALEL